jgi:hypothetical protein
MEYEVKRNQSQRRHTFNVENPSNAKEKKPRTPASNNLTISRVLGYTSAAAYKRIKSPRNPNKGIYVPGLRFAPSEARPISCSEFGITPTNSTLRQIHLVS